eukprot:14752056-Alexandrium_andersonii.AAC.1
MKHWLVSNTDTVEDELPSFSTFRRVHLHWTKVLKIRDVGSHARCTVCAELSERLRQARDPQLKADIIAAKEKHLNSMFADRDLESKMNLLSESSCASNCSFSGRVLKLDID